MYKQYLKVVEDWIANPCLVTQAELEDNYNEFYKLYDRIRLREYLEEDDDSDAAYCACTEAKYGSVEGAMENVAEYYRLRAGYKKENEEYAARELKLELERASSPEVLVPILMEKVKTMELQIEKLSSELLKLKSGEYT